MLYFCKELLDTLYVASSGSWCAGGREGGWRWRTRTGGMVPIRAVPDTAFLEYRFSVFVKGKYLLIDHVRPRMASMRGGGGLPQTIKGWGGREGRD